MGPAQEQARCGGCGQLIKRRDGAPAGPRPHPSPAMARGPGGAGLVCFEAGRGTEPRRCVCVCVGARPPCLPLAYRRLFGVEEGIPRRGPLWAWPAGPHRRMDGRSRRHGCRPVARPLGATRARRRWCPYVPLFIHVRLKAGLAALPCASRVSLAVWPARRGGEGRGLALAPA